MKNPHEEKAFAADLRGCTRIRTKRTTKSLKHRGTEDAEEEQI
jgi:hypothetical protein